MYAYNLLVYTPGSPNPGEWEPVRPGPDTEIPTLDLLKQQVLHDLGFVPDWLESLVDPAEYIAVEDDQQINDSWFLLDIEGSEETVLPPLALRISWERSKGRSG